MNSYILAVLIMILSSCTLYGFLAQSLMPLQRDLKLFARYTQEQQITGSEYGPYTVYFAGELFNHKHLIGNYQLAHSITEASQNKFTFIMPQDLKGNNKRDSDIRNNNIKHIMHSDIILCNFDGPDLDSGTIVEFIIAKMLDIPCVVVRTDFRKGGDSSYTGGDPWNIMSSGYPRTVTVKINSLQLYKELGIKAMYEKLASMIHEALITALKEPSVLTTKQQILNAYLNVRTCCGSGLENVIQINDIGSLVERKVKDNIYQL